MSVTESGPDLMSEVIALLLDALVVALSQRGLPAERRGSRMVSASSNLANRPSGAPLAVVDPGLRQTVICLPDRAGWLSWFWVRPRPTRDAPSGLDYLGPAGYIGATADRITRAFRPDGLGMERVR